MTDSSNTKQILEGVVVSDKMQKTIVVEVSRFIRHAKYGKFIKRSKRFKAHVEGDKPKVGEKVAIVACRPVSKDKRFMLVVK